MSDRQNRPRRQVNHQVAFITSIPFLIAGVYLVVCVAQEMRFEFLIHRKAELLASVGEPLNIGALHESKMKNAYREGSDQWLEVIDLAEQSRRLLALEEVWFSDQDSIDDLNLRSEEDRTRAANTLAAIQPLMEKAYACTHFPTPFAMTTRTSVEPLDSFNANWAPGIQLQGNLYEIIVFHAIASELKGDAEAVLKDLELFKFAVDAISWKVGGQTVDRIPDFYRLTLLVQKCFEKNMWNEEQLAKLEKILLDVEERILEGSECVAEARAMNWELMNRGCGFHYQVEMDALNLPSDRWALLNSFWPDSTSTSQAEYLSSVLQGFGHVHAFQQVRQAQYLPPAYLQELVRAKLAVKAMKYRRKHGAFPNRKVLEKELGESLAQFFGSMGYEVDGDVAYFWNILANDDQTEPIENRKRPSKESEFYRDQKRMEVRGS